MIERRYCIGCRHLEISLGSETYSDVTPGAPGSVWCDKGHFDIEPEDLGADSEVIYKAMCRAASCPDYQEREAS